MPILSPDVGERLAGLQLGRGTLSRPSLAWEQDPDTGIMHRGVQGEFSFVSNGVEVGRVTADGFLLPLLNAGRVVITSATGTLTDDAGLTYIAATDRLTVAGDIIVPFIGPAAAQLHTLPAVAADTIALIAATQTLTNKTLTSPVLGGTVIGTYTLAGTPTVGANLLFTDNTFDIGASGATRPRNLFLSGDATIGDQLVVSGTGPHVIGGGLDAAVQFKWLGTFAGVGLTRGLSYQSSLTPTANTDGVGFYLAPTIVEAASGAHAELGALSIQPTFTAGLATATDVFSAQIIGFSAPSGSTNASTLKIATAPLGATNNYALWVAVGASRLDGLLTIGTADLTLGQLAVDQASTTAAIPVISLEQRDIDQDWFEFDTTIGTGNATEAVGIKSLTTTHFLKVTITGVGTRYIPVGTIA